MRTDALSDHVCSWQKRTCALLTGVRVFDPELKRSTTAGGEDPTHTQSLSRVHRELRRARARKHPSQLRCD